MILPIREKQALAELVQQKGIDVICTNAITGAGMQELKSRLKIMRPKLETAAAKGRIQKPIKTMIVGSRMLGNQHLSTS